MKQRRDNPIKTAIMKNFIKKRIALLALFGLGLLQAKAYNVVVAKDGSGNYTTVQAAIDAAPTGSTAPYTIFIKNGRYREKNTVPATKPFIQLIGESVANVFIYYDDPATVLGTQNSASFTVSANDFSAFNITFANTFGDGSQAVAVLVNADRAAFKNCRFLGNQDTIYLKGSGTPRNYFKNCYIDGNVDFIFGSAVAVFDSCVVYAKSRTSTSSSFITAPNTPTGQAYGFVFRNTALTANTGGTSYYLSRPWPSPDVASTAQKTVYLSCQLSSHIQPTGWSTWDANTITANLYYGEYNSKYFNGTNVDVSQRVSWSKQLTQSDSSTYTFANMFGSWDPCTVSVDYCNAAGRDIAVSNFKGTKGTTTSTFNWNISWPMTGIKYDLYRSTNNVSFSIVNTQTAVSDTAVNFNYTEAVPPPGQTYYYYINASKAGFAAHITDTVSISSIPTITVTGSTGSFIQGVGIPSSAQSYSVSGANLTDNITITAPANYELSSNSGTTWYNSSTPVVLTQTSGTVAATTILVRLNAASPGTYSGNVVHVSTGAATVNLAVSGTVQSTPLTVSTILQQWPFTLSNQDSAGVRSPGVVASVPTFNKLTIANGTTIITGTTVMPPYSALHGQAYGASSNGDGTWTTAVGGPGGNLNRTNYEQFTITASSNYSVRIDSLILNSSFYNTSSNTKLAVVYSKTGFTTADSTDVTGTGGLGGFATPILLTNETTTGTTANYRIAFNGATGISLASGETLTFRIYNSCGSSSAARYGKIKNLYIMGLATINPVTGDYRSHQSGDWADVNTWERYDGTTWVTPAPAYPVYNNSQTTNILNGHTVSVSANLTNGSGYIHLTKVNQGGQLVVSSGVTLNLANDGAPSTATTDLQVDGTMTQLGTIGTNGNVSLVINGTYVASGTLNMTNAGDSVLINSGGTYQHNVNTGSTPTNIKGAVGSTFLVTGITTNQTNIFKSASTYGNIVWNCASQSQYYAFRNNLTATNVLGSFTVTSTGTSYISFSQTSGTTTFPGGYYQTGGTVNVRENSNITYTLSVGGDFSISGGTFNSNAITGSLLNINLTGTGKTLNYAQSGATFTNFAINGTYTLASSLVLPYSSYITPTAGSISLGNYNITLSSNSSGTARVAQASVATPFVYSGTGRFIVQRYVAGGSSAYTGTIPTQTPGKRAFRFLSHPFNAYTDLTQLTDDIDITGSGATNPATNALFTQTTTNAASAYWFDPTNAQAGTNDATNTDYGWQAFTNALPASGTDNNAWKVGQGIRVLVRGTKAQANSLDGTVSYTANNVTLGMSGQLNIATTPIATNLRTNGTVGAGWNVIGNPLPSTIEIKQKLVTLRGASSPFNNIGAIAYVWNPNKTGTNKGGYDAIDISTTATGTYNLPMNGVVLVQTTVNNNTALNFSESDKVSNAADLNFRTSSVGNNVAINLEYNGTVLDETMIRFNAISNTNAEASDGGKMLNQNSIYSLTADNAKAYLNSLPEPAINDRIKLGLYITDPMSYNLKVIDIDIPVGKVAFLKDNYLNVEQPILATGFTYAFTVTADAATQGDGRFELVFRSSSALPVTFTNIKAYQKNDGIQVEWNVAKEINTDKYEVEKSADGIHFDKVATIAAIGNAIYNWFDASPIKGDNFYRVKAVDKSAASAYTAIVKVKIGKGNNQFAIAPTLIQNGTLVLQLENVDKGKYAVNIFNNAGQLMSTKNINHAGGSATETMDVSRLAKGSYHVQVTGNNTSTTKKIVIE